MTTRTTFYLTGETQLEETKKIIRELPSLRFDSNPQRFNSGRYHLSVSGEGSDIQQLQRHLENYRTSDRENFSEGFLDFLFELFCDED